MGAGNAHYSFIAIAEQLHFGRAAEQVHPSQPALSLQISDMEEELGVPLLLRSRRSTQLTEAGKVFLVEARETLNRLEQAVLRTGARRYGKRERSVSALSLPRRQQ